MQVDDLFVKIGILVMENDSLRAELSKITQQAEELKRELEALRSEKAGSPAKKG